MASGNIGALRLVKCPKCSNVLVEVANVPVYKCGGCNAVLRAKISLGNTENGTTNPIQKTSKTSEDNLDSTSLNDDLPSSENKDPNFDNGAEQVRRTGERSSDPNATSSLSIREESSGNGENGVDKTRLEINNTSELASEVRNVESKEDSSLDGEDSNSRMESNPMYTIHRDLLSNNFRSNSVLKRKILKTVDELRGELSELFGKSAEVKPRAHPEFLKPEHRGHRRISNSSVPLRAYHPAVNAAQVNRSAQVAFPGRARRYIRQKTGSCCHCGHIRSCTHDCCRHRRMDCSYNPHCCKNQMQDSGFKKPLTKGKGRQPKHHCRPILGGAPFVICSNCLKLVQLPADFIVSTKRQRKLQCGSCSEVLLYNYRDPKNAKPRSPSEIEHSTDSYDRHEIMNSCSVDWPQADPISYSEEHGHSFGGSYSTEPEHPLYVSRNSSFITIDETNGMETHNSRLHRLMGYSSASELLLQPLDLSDSFEREASFVNRPFEETNMHDRKGKGICMSKDPDEEDDSFKRSRNRHVGLPLHGILRKGIQSLIPD